MEFVSRHYATFLNGTKIRGVLRAQFTFSTYMEFVKWARKSPVERLTAEKFFAKICAGGVFDEKI